MNQNPEESSKESHAASATVSKIRLLPIVETLRNYNLQKARSDISAAVNVALLDFPQGMAYALIAGLPVQIGIFCSALASLVGPLFASSRFVMLGPTNATAVMLLSAFLTLGYGPEQAIVAMPLLLIMVGIFMTVGAFFKVGNVVQFVSRTVVTGYITAAAFLIIVNQMKTVLGLQVPRAGTFIESLYLLIKGIPETQWDAFIVSIITLAIYLPLKKWGRGLPNVAIALFLVAAITSLLRGYGIHPEMLKSVEVTQWPLTLPVANFDQFAKLANAALAISFLSMLESSSIAKTLAAQSGDRIDLNQQMFSMGIANFTCALGSGMAVSGSLTRSVLNYRSGAKTPMASMFSGIFLILGLFLLGPHIAHIPRAALATLVIIVGFSLINRGQIGIMLRTTKSDATVFLTTFIGGLLLALDTAIYLGAAASIVFFMRKASRPTLKEIRFDESGSLKEQSITQSTEKRPEIAIVHVQGDLFFASCDIFLDQMRNIVEHADLKIVIIRLRNAYHLDASVALTLKELVNFARENGRDIIVSGAHEEVERIFRNSNLMDLLGEDNFFRYHPENPTISTRDALKRAQVLMGGESADITIFAADKNSSD